MVEIYVDTYVPFLELKFPDKKKPACSTVEFSEEKFDATSPPFFCVCVFVFKPRVTFYKSVERDIN